MVSCKYFLFVIIFHSCFAVIELLILSYKLFSLYYFFLNAYVFALCKAILHLKNVRVGFINGLFICAVDNSMYILKACIVVTFVLSLNITRESESVSTLVL